MITEEYLNKMGNLKNKRQETGKNEIQEKKSLPFTIGMGQSTFFSIYQNLSHSKRYYND